MPLGIDFEMQDVLEAVRLVSRSVLDSRSYPTVKARISAVLIKEKRMLNVTAEVPSGASTGTHEAYELRDNEIEYGGKGVNNAVSNVNTRISSLLQQNLNISSPDKFDIKMIELDGTENKSQLGANAILASSIALHRLYAECNDMPLYEYLRKKYFPELSDIYRIPRLMSNVINGGVHADSGIDIQEFMIVAKADNIDENVRLTSEVYNLLKKKLKDSGYSISLGDEGGFAPHLKTNEESLKIILETIESSGYRDKFEIALDCAASEYYDSKIDRYKLDSKLFTREELCTYYINLINKYNISSIEDPFHEDDYEGWSLLTAKIGDKVKIVGDDLFVTNIKRLQTLGVEKKLGNMVLIKPNQIGTVLETVNTIKLAQANNFGTIISHRSGETCDTFIADLAVASNSEFIKLGAPARGERVAKYNRLLDIYDEINSKTYVKDG